MDKYLHICGSFKSGGITNFVKGIIDENEKSDSVHYVAILNYDKAYEDQYLIDISECRRNFWGALKIAKEVKQKYKKVFVHCADYLLMVAFYIMNVECYFFQHGMSVSHGAKLKRQLKKYWHSLLPVIFNTKIICSSEFAANKSRSLGIKMSDKRIRIIQFGTDITRRIGIKKRDENQPIIIGTAGRLATIKRFDTLLESLIDYSMEQELEIRIAGDGSEKEILMDISQKIESSKITVNFLGMIDDMENFYDDLDLFLFPSHNESYGLVVLEALYRNVPVALFKDVGGALHLVNNGRNGWVFDDIDDGLDKLWEILNTDWNQLHSMKKYISEFDFEKFHIKDTRKEIEAIN